MKSILLAFVAVTANHLAVADSAPVVAVTGGQVRGVRLDKAGAAFQGIPFAQAPVGNLRWREPIPVKPWTGVRDATMPGAICAQNSGVNALNAREISSEDCLFLNVWTPEWPVGGRKPVMVWIPGGGNFAGGSGLPVNDGKNLSGHGVVVVTINYRVGLFGFFAHPELTRESAHHASGNQGILDQIAALQWVQKNIAKFGGDSSNVTIFGQSAGSFNASVLMTSPLSKGLFRRVIGESGAVILLGDPLNLAVAEKEGQSFAELWNPGATSLRGIRAVPASEILEKQPDYLTSNRANLGIVVDGYVFPRRPADVFAAGQEHRVALLLGNNARERIPGSTPPADVRKAIEDSYGPVSSRALTIYSGAADPLYGTPADQWATDTSFRCSAVAQLLWHSAAGNPAFEFQFDRGRGQLGAVHGVEVEYVFNTFGTRPTTSAIHYDAVDAALSDAVQQYWTNFAKKADPNGGNLPVWPAFDSTSRSYMAFTDAGPVSKEALRRPFCDLFIDNLRSLK